MRKKMGKTNVIALLIATVLAGCTTQASLMSEGDWYRLGNFAGQRGEKPVSEQVLVDKAMKVDGAEAPDYSQYLEGYKTGIDKYCSLEQMERIGLEGKTDWGGCEFRREEGGLYTTFWQKGFDRRLSFNMPSSH